MSATDDAITSLLARVVSNYLTNGGYVNLFPQDLRDVATIAQYVAQLATAASGSASLAAGSLAAAQAITGATQGIGTEPLDIPRVAELGSAAFLDIEQLKGLFPSPQNAAYQVTLLDAGRLLLTSSGTNTWTLPAAADLPDGWWCLGRNRSGAILTIARTGADTINGAAANASIATGTATFWVVKQASSNFEVG